jgi:hypothetical protein
MAKGRQGMPADQLDPLRVFISSFGVSSFAGLAALLRSGKTISVLSVFSAMLNTGLVGLAIALIWYHRFRGNDENVYFLIGVCVLAGLGGTTAIDFIVQVCRRGGLQITIAAQDDDKELPEEE